MEIVMRSVVMFAALWLLLRAMGKRELSEVTAFELVVLVVLGDLVQNGVTQEDMSLTGSFLAVCTMALLAVGVSTVTYRYPKTRRALEGLPSVVIKDGTILPEVLRLQRISLDELKEAARKEGISDLRHVTWGIVESDGAFSFLTGEPDGP